MPGNESKKPNSDPRAIVPASWGESLTPEAAYNLALELTLIPDCSRFDPAVEALARDLEELCSTEGEARWLVHEARHTWETWQGTAGLIGLLVRRNAKPVTPIGNEAPSFELPPDVCRKCRGWGIVHRPGEDDSYCSCDAGQELQNRKPPEQRRPRGLTPIAAIDVTAVPVTPPRGPITEADIERAFRERQRDTDGMIARQRAILADPDATKDSKEIAREILRGFDLTE